MRSWVERRGRRPIIARRDGADARLIVRTAGPTHEDEKIRALANRAVVRSSCEQRVVRTMIGRQPRCKSDDLIVFARRPRRPTNDLIVFVRRPRCSHDQSCAGPVVRPMIERRPRCSTHDLITFVRRPVVRTMIGRRPRCSSHDLITFVQRPRCSRDHRALTPSLRAMISSSSCVGPAASPMISSPSCDSPAVRPMIATRPHLFAR